MKTIRTFTLTCALLTAIAAVAQTPAPSGAQPPARNASAPTGGAADRMAMMDGHMAAMRTLHEKMVAARTPEQRQALMAEQMKLMQEGMAMMGGMGPTGMGMGMGMGGMGPVQGGQGAPADMATRQQMMEKRMDMMQSMMQMMMDRTAAPAARP